MFEKFTAETSAWEIWKRADVLQQKN